jgi:hypothetical protein
MDSTSLISCLLAGLLTHWCILRSRVRQEDGEVAQIISKYHLVRHKEAVFTQLLYNDSAFRLTASFITLLVTARYSCSPKSPTWLPEVFGTKKLLYAVSMNCRSSCFGYVCVAFSQFPYTNRHWDRVSYKFSKKQQLEKWQIQSCPRIHWFSVRGLPRPKKKIGKLKK